MENVIDDLYFGRITPCDRCSTPKESELMGRISECFDNLSEGLTEEQRVGLENFKDYLMEVSVISEREMFESTKANSFTDNPPVQPFASS